MNSACLSMLALGGALLAQSPLEPPQKAVLDRVAEYAREYGKRMPDFVCTRITRRTRAKAGSEEWKLLDTMEEEVTIVGEKETHKLMKVNGKTVKPGAHKPSGFLSAGEFRSHLTSIFDQGKHPVFQWDREEVSGGRHIAVFRFQVSRKESAFTVSDKKKKASVGYSGLLYAEDSGVVERLHVETEDPEGFEYSGITTDVRFIQVTIAGRDYRLTGQAELRIRRKGEVLRREMEFRDYHKYGADTAVTFDVPR